MRMLSPNFSLAEMCITTTGLENTPDEQQIKAMEALCEFVLEPVRAHFKKPIYVSSGFRSFKVNAAASKKPSNTSQHLFGEAADIEIAGVRNDDIYCFIRDAVDADGKPLIPFDQLIAEKLKRADGSAGWIHVSYRKNRLRRDAISWLGGSNYVKGLDYVG